MFELQISSYRQTKLIYAVMFSKQSPHMSSLYLLAISLEHHYYNEKLHFCEGKFPTDKNCIPHIHSFVGP